jgi:ABC-type transport system substrate-binding protein/DNA-binding SARP family transcriptional activator
MDVHLLGPIEARVDHEPIALGPGKQRAVLAMLALKAGRTVSADRLAEGLWGQRAPPSAAKMVQLYVSHLRRLLDGGGAEILTRGRGYELQLRDGEVDALRFERLLDESRPREALALWRGEALADVADEPFAAAEIRRLDELHVRAAEEAIDADLAAGHHGEVIGELETLVAANPLREKLHAQRILALYRSGRQAEALEAYAVARAGLVDQIGVEPGPELRRLQRAVLAQDPALELAPSPEPPARAKPARRRPRRAAPVLAAAALLILAGLTVFGVSRVLGPDRLSRIDENFVGLIDPGDGRITEEFAVGREPGAMVAGAGSLWVANTRGGTVSRIDRAHDQVDDRVFTIDVGGEPVALAFGGGSLWVADGEARTVHQVDPSSNRVIRSVDVGNAPRAVTSGFGALWVASTADGVVRRIDLRRDTASRTTTVSSPAAIAAGGDAVWVASEETGRVVRLNPRSGEQLGSVGVGNGPSAVAVGEGAVWVANRLDGTVMRIDQKTYAVDGIARVGGDPAGVAAGDGGVWVAGGSDGTVTRLDPETARILGRTPIQSSSTAVASADGFVWAAGGAPPASHRGGTLRVLATFPKNPQAIDWLSQDAYLESSWQLMSLAYDGLVAYRRVAGAAGGTLVGALATAVPAPSQDGRSYVFTLRRGVRYSDGRLVRPEDVRASIERFLRVTREQFTPSYDAIVGAEQCAREPARCDLSRGIEADARANTVTFHLTRPDPELMHKLALPFAYVVPADTPVRRSGDVAPPGTGPYRFAAWDAERGGSLVRNPHFRSSSAPARPAGFVDRIDVDAHHGHAAEAQVEDVRRGAADLAVIANPFVALFPAKRLGALEVRSPGRLQSHPEAFLGYMFLNTRTPPFDDVRARRALNYATDRARVAELEGGAELATATCQILPPAFPGYKPYCPYTAQPGAGRGWTAPDMERARRLVAESGTAGERIVVLMVDRKPAIGRYFTRLLDELGYRASLRVLPYELPAGKGEDYDSAIRRPRAQIGLVGWLADNATPSTFTDSTLSCASLASPLTDNLSGFCDPALDRQVERARAATGSEAVARWSAVDHRLTDLAPVVPLVNRRSVDFVARRVGNVQHHLQGYTMLDQLWVR